MKNKSIALILVVLMLLTMQPVAVFAQTDTDAYATTTSPDDTIVASESTQNTETFGPPAEEEIDTQQRATGSLPIDYKAPAYTPKSLRRVRAGELEASSYVTPFLPTRARDQGNYGTCWAHAMLLAAEVSMIKQGANPNSINLSELQLAWFHHRGPKNSNGDYEDPLNNFGGDRNIYNGNPFDGDNVLYAMKTLASWMGPMQEDATTAYGNASSIIASNALNYSYAFSKDAAHLSNVRWIKIEGKEDIKQAVIDYGAVIIDYRHGVTSDEINALYNGYYYYADESADADTNHSVAIIGWDDEIGASNFKSTSAGAGAWLVRNSWGTGPKTGSNADGNFYMSYNTKYVSKGSSAWVLEVAPLGSSDYCYQYDGTSSLESISVSPSETTKPKAANIFKSKQGESIVAVSFWLDLMAGVPYTIDIYTGGTSDNPVSGTLKATVSGTTNNAGYYTIPLPPEKHVPVAAGELFSAVVTFTNSPDSDGKISDFELPLDATSSAFGGLMTMESHSSEKQSFVWIDDYFKWQDASKLTGATGPGNCRVKVFTTKVPVESIKILSDTNVMYPGHTYQLSAEVSPANATNKAVDMTIRSGADVATVTSDGKLTTIKTGTVTVRATAKDGSGVFADQTFTISDGKPTLTSIKITRPPNKITYFKGSALDTTGLVVSAVYNDNSKVNVTDAVKNTLTGFDGSVIGKSVVTATYQGHTATFNTYTFGGVGMSISLEGMIAINFKAVFPDYKAAKYTPGMLAFTSNPTSKQIQDAYAAGKNRVAYTTEGTETEFKYSKAAKEMTEKVYIVLFAASKDADGKEHVTFGKPSGWSVVDFANIGYNAYKTSPHYTLIRTMLTDMLNYGAKAQEFFNHHTDDLANSKLTPEQKSYASTKAVTLSRTRERFKDGFSSSTSKIDVANFSLTLESEISLNFYARIAGNVRLAELLIFDSYKPNSGYNYYHGSASKIVKMKLQTSGSDSGKYMGSIPNIVAKEMRKPRFARIYAELNNGTKLYSDVIRYDVENHVYTIKNSSQYLNQWPLTEAMMRYGDSAKAYFDATQ